MVIAFQIVLLVVILGAFGNIDGEGKDKPVNAGVCIAAIIAFIVSMLWL